VLIVVARVVGGMLAYLGVLSILAGVLTVIGLQMLGDAATGILGLAALGIAEAGALVAVLVLWRMVDKRPLVEMGFASRPAVQQALRGSVVALLLMGVVVLLAYLLPGVLWRVNPDPVRAALALVIGLLAFVVQGSSEEVLFRGYILENVRARWGIQWGVAASAGAFALLHAANPAFDVLPLINLVLFGVVTGFYKLYVDRGQLWGVCAIHAVWNWLQQVVFGLPNSGQAPPVENTLISIQPNESLPAFVWGGGFGPEGTLAATVVLAALLGYTLRRRQSAELYPDQAPTSA
jgi:membrane protease YdiL (CAAX protease family)